MKTEEQLEFKDAMGEPIEFGIIYTYPEFIKRIKGMIKWIKPDGKCMLMTVDGDYGEVSSTHLFREEYL